MLTAILQMTMKASNMSNKKYIYPYVFMTDNDNNLDKEQTMKTIWTMTTTTTTTMEGMRVRNMLTAILQMMMRASDIMIYLSLCIHDRQ